jgi:hypothetical protein
MGRENHDTEGGGDMSRTVGKNKGGSAPERAPYECSIFKELIICSSPLCAHFSHPREVTEPAVLGAIPGGWREVHVEKRQNAAILSFPLLREGRVVVIIKVPGTTVWWG